MIRNSQNECYLYEHCPKWKNGECKLEKNVYCIRLHKLDALYDMALISDNHRKPMALWAPNEDREAYLYLKQYKTDIIKHVENGDSLFIHSSNCGNGKTEWAYKLLKSYLGNIWATSPLTCRGLFVEVPRFFISLKDNISKPSEYANYIKEHIMEADLVVFDEVGAKGLTEFEHEQLLTIINNRISNNKSNIYTSNLSADELIGTVGERLASRIISLSDDIEFFGADQRGKMRVGQ